MLYHDHWPGAYSNERDLFFQSFILRRIHSKVLIHACQPDSLCTIYGLVSRSRSPILLAQRRSILFLDLLYYNLPRESERIVLFLRLLP